MTLGIDPGTLFCGYALLEHSKRTTLRKFGVIKLKRKEPMQKRLRDLYLFFEDLITSYGVERMAIETPFYSRNVQVTMKLSYVRGILMLLCEEYDVELFEYAPTQVKQAITGWGSAPKTQVATALYQLFPMLKTLSHDDISDAIAVGLTCIWKK